MGSELPTRTLKVPPLKAVTNQALSSFSTVSLVLVGWLFNYYAFPVVASAILPVAFSDEVIEQLARSLAMDLAAPASQVGRPVADTVLSSVVMPSVGILFATLTSTTLATLRQRQQDLRTALRKECTAFETLLMPVRKLFADDARRYSRALCLLLQYAEDVMADTSSLTDSALKRRLFDSERATMLAVLAVVAEADASLVREGTPIQTTIVYSRVVGYAQGLCNQINGLRASRRSSFLSAFPSIHWLLLITLGFTIPTLYIILASTSKGVSLALLSDELIRALFATLSTLIGGLVVLLADLNDPFAGNYRVTDGEAFEAARQQIYASLDELAREDACMRQLHEELARLAVDQPERLASVYVEPAAECETP